MAELPSGTVTFLLTDIEGSTALWERAPAAMRAALARHDALLTARIEAHGGAVVKNRDEAGLRDLGAHRLKDLQDPECVHQLVLPDLRADFPALRTLHARPNNLPVP